MSEMNGHWINGGRARSCDSDMPYDVAKTIVSAAMKNHSALAKSHDPVGGWKLEEQYERVSKVNRKGKYSGAIKYPK